MLTDCKTDTSKNTLKALCFGSREHGDSDARHALFVNLDSDASNLIASTCSCEAPFDSAIKLCPHVAAALVYMCSLDLCLSTTDETAPASIAAVDYRAPNTLASLRGPPLSLQDVQVSELIAGRLVFIAGHSVSSDPLWLGCIGVLEGESVEVDCLPKLRSPAQYAWNGTSSKICIPVSRIVRVISEPFQAESRKLKLGLWNDLCKVVRQGWRWGQPQPKQSCLWQKSPSAKVDDKEQKPASNVCLVAKASVAFALVTWQANFFNHLF